MEGKGKALSIVISIVFLGVVGYHKFSLPLDSAMFNPDSMYRGTSHGAVVDPKEYYNKLHGMTMSDLEDEACITSVKSLPNAVSIGSVGNYYPVLINAEKTDNYASLIGTDGEGMFTNKQEIIMPVSSGKFKNSNMLKSSLEEEYKDRVDIEIIVSNKILIVFEDVTTWWCHAHNPDSSTTHDKAVGNSSQSEIKEVRGGFIIGVAKDTTKMKVYSVTDKVFKDNILSENVDSINQLDQIDAGAYLTNGDIKIVK